MVSIKKPEKTTTWKIQALVGGNTNLHLKEAGEKGVDWIYQAQDKNKWRPLVNTAMNVRITLLDSRGSNRFSRTTLRHGGDQSFSQLVMEYKVKFPL